MCRCPSFLKFSPGAWEVFWSWPKLSAPCVRAAKNEPPPAPSPSLPGSAPCSDTRPPAPAEGDLGARGHRVNFVGNLLEKVSECHSRLQHSRRCPGASSRGDIHLPSPFLLPR